MGEVRLFDAVVAILASSGGSAGLEDIRARLRELELRGLLSWREEDLNLVINLMVSTRIAGASQGRITLRVEPAGDYARLVESIAGVWR